MLPEPHPDTAIDYYRLKQIQKGGQQAIEDKAIAAYMRAYEERGREEAEQIYFSFFNKRTMADRTSARLFGKVFQLLAKNPTEEHKAIAAELWPEIQEYDFSEYQMYCDDALIALNLARMCVNPKYPEDGEVIIYGPLKSQP